MEIREELYADKNQINAVQGQRGMYKDMIWKIIDKFKTLKQDENKLAKKNARLIGELTKVTRKLTEVTRKLTELTEENAKQVIMVEYLTIKVNKTTENLDYLNTQGQTVQAGPELPKA
jgi:chromosome segregation ATPase